MRYAVIGLVFGLLLGAGGMFLALKHEHDKDPHREESEAHSSQRTVWTDRHEIFVEHPPLIAGMPAVFVTHVTDLASLEPRKAGAIAYEIDGRVETSAAPIRPGIYTPSLTFPKAGDWKVQLRVDESRIDLGSFEVHSSKADAESHSHDEPEGISFLKEQQWKLSTKSETVGTRKLVQRLRVPGVVTPRPGSRAAVSPPVEGRLLAPPGRALPRVGETVEAGQVLGLVQPPFSDFAAKLIEAEAEIIRSQVSLEQAETTAERLRKLVAENARPARELAEAEFALRTARTNVEASKSLRSAYAKGGAVLGGDGLPVFELRAPISGTVLRAAATAGEHVHTENAVFTIFDASRVWVEARVSEADFNRLGASAPALLEMPYGRDHLRQAGTGPAHVADEVDPATRTVAVMYDVENVPRDLRIGLAVTLHIETARTEDGIAIPESALVDLEGRFVAFVQLAGETFEKRDLVLGIRDGGFAQVMSGLKVGERVVTRGAYAVRLASASASIPAHGHSH